ncbi:MAG: TPM domain-containing protein, partial [Nitrososphaerales archaeon]
MKHSPTYFFLIAFTIVLIACKVKAASNRNWVYDYESVLDSSQRERLANLYIGHERKTTNEIVLITTPTYENDTSILFYSVNKFRQLGIGKKNINNGVLIVYSGANRQVRITNGYG